MLTPVTAHAPIPPHMNVAKKLKDSHWASSAGPCWDLGVRGAAAGTRGGTLRAINHEIVHGPLDLLPSACTFAQGFPAYLTKRRAPVANRPPT